MKGHLDAVTDRAAAPVIAKYTGRAGRRGHRSIYVDDHVRHHAVAALLDKGLERSCSPLRTRMTARAVAGDWPVPRGRANLLR